MGRFVGALVCVLMLAAFASVADGRKAARKAGRVSFVNASLSACGKPNKPPCPTPTPTPTPTATLTPEPTSTPTPEPTPSPTPTPTPDPVPDTGLVPGEPTRGTTIAAAEFEDGTRGTMDVQQCNAEDLSFPT